jgi:hypothetical protein
MAVIEHRFVLPSKTARRVAGLSQDKCRGEENQRRQVNEHLFISFRNRPLPLKSSRPHLRGLYSRVSII